MRIRILQVFCKADQDPHHWYFVQNAIPKLILSMYRQYRYYFCHGKSFFSLYLFLALGGGFPLYPEFLQYDTMILHRPRIIVGDAGFEPGTSASEVWRATNEPPHLHMKSAFLSARTKIK